mgnify:CR=1 FL=1
MKIANGHGELVGDKGLTHPAKISADRRKIAILDAAELEIKEEDISSTSHVGRLLIGSPFSAFQTSPRVLRFSPLTKKQHLNLFCCDLILFVHDPTSYPALNIIV